MLKDPNLLNLIKSLEKYDIRNIQEIFFHFNSEEYFNYVLLKKEIVENFINLYKKYIFDLQRKDPFKFLLTYKYNKENVNQEAITNLENLFKMNNINIKEFIITVKQLLEKSNNRKNTLWLYGPPGTGKTMIAMLISKLFATYYGTSQGQDGDFYFSGWVNQNLIVLEELFAMPQTLEDMKKLFQGIPVDVNYKYATSKIRIERTPIIVTSNHELAGRGFANHLDEVALKERCYHFNFLFKFVPTIKIDICDFQYFLCKHFYQ